MVFPLVSRWQTVSAVLLLTFYASSVALAQSKMPPSPHLPDNIRAEMRQNEAKKAWNLKNNNRPVRDAGKRDVVNDPVAAPAVALVSDTKAMPCVLMHFPDYANTYTKEAFQNLLFTPSGVTTGSATDYYAEVSYNQVALTGLVDGWYTTDNNKTYYADKTGRYADCAYEAAQKADAAKFNWAPYDNDKDGYVDTLWVVHSGLGAEESGSTRTDIWSHSWNFVSAGKGVFTTSTPDPNHPGSFIKINDYIIQPETSYWSGGNGYTKSIVGIGVFCHEFGHALGLPDLYDTAGSGEGLGNASLMAGGSWGGDGDDSRYPAHLDAWSKAYLGWASPNIVAENGIFQLDYSARSSTSYLVKPQASSSNQYFLIENRQRYGFDRTLFATGLFIYHIDPNIINTYMYSNTVNSNTHAYGVALEEADATVDSYSYMHLFVGLNRGLASDSWQVGRVFSASSVPSTKTNSGVVQQCSIAPILGGDVMNIDIKVTQANIAPVAAADSYKVAANKTLSVRAPGVLANDSDANGDPLTAVLVSGPLNSASFTLSANGAFTYRPKPGFVGTDTFTYHVSDGLVTSNTATVTITVTKTKK